MRSEHVSDTVNKIFLENGDEIILVGTAHVSQDSVDEVRRVIDEEQPDHICLELDKGRYESKTKEQSYANMNLTKVFKEGKTFLVLANTALASFQKKMLSHGIMVRDCSSFGPEFSSYVRYSVKDRERNCRFLAAVDSVING